MNELLKNKIEQLKSAAEYECWYLVKQPTEFGKLCYLVYILKEYQDNNSTEVLSKYIENRISQLQSQDSNVEFSNNYRALRVAAFFGLIKMNGANYKNAKITPTYHEIAKRCSNKFENVETYGDIIDRQIEKIFLSSDIDEEKDGVRKEFRLYPIMLLYKVLIELGRTTGEYSISLTEYKYLVATTKKFEDYLDTILLIKMMRDDTSVIPEFEQFSAKFDNRMLQALKQLNTLVVTNKSISVNPARLEEVAKKVFIFENDSNLFIIDNYLNFLGSTKALIELYTPEISTEGRQENSFTTEWFQQEAALLGNVDEEASELYGEFRSKFSPEILKTLDGIDILHRIFLNDTNKRDNLCYILEYDKRYSIFGSIASGAAYKYGLFYSPKKQSWITGSSRKPQILTEKQAIEVGKRIRDELIAGAEIISNFGELKEVKDYADLHAKLYTAMPNTIGRQWVMKYFHMIFPDLFTVFYNEEWQRKALDKTEIEADENSFIRMGQIALFVKKCGISNVAFFKVVQNIGDGIPNVAETEPIVSPYSFDADRNGAQNRVIYGTPGCGKSYYVENTLLLNLEVAVEDRIRTTFYQDYSNTDFVGQIIPKVHSDKTVTYDFNPGPFALALKKAIENPEKPVALIIEELNRGNAASIFGDIFQLLDRDKTGKSHYSITNVNLQDYLNKCFSENSYVFNEIYIPSNLHIIATMNTSDQNVFTLDTAFKRRWQFEKLRNTFGPDHEYKGYYVPGMPDITWQQLVDDINAFIVNNSNELSSEDKQLGVYFIDKETLCEKVEDCSDNAKKTKFAYKLFEYLWDDVAKFGRTDWFGAEVKTLDNLIDAYLTKGKKVFVDGIISEQNQN
ncbi:MAG: AAA family ATPase [Oscillospiraceae bacterium]|nr:AAA family ATPase [Oscillospiraceae bacterium]